MISRIWYKVVIEPFEKAHPDIKVTDFAQPTSAQMLGTLGAQKASPQSDVMIFDSVVSKAGIDEGLRIPFPKLEREGVPDKQLWEIIALNVRVPEQVVGDLNAQMAACTAGRRGLIELMER